MALYDIQSGAAVTEEAFPVTAKSYHAKCGASSNSGCTFADARRYEDFSVVTRGRWPHTLRFASAWNTTSRFSLISWTSTCISISRYPDALTSLGAMKGRGSSR
jgi:hypothetical protein